MLRSNLFAKHLCQPFYLSSHEEFGELLLILSHLCYSRDWEGYTMKAIETERLTIRPFVMDDLEEIHNVIS